MKIKNIMPKECAITATIEQVELKNLGNADMPNYMQMDIVKTATLISTTM